MKHVYFLAACLCVGHSIDLEASDLIPTLEDAGYAHEAIETCSGMAATFKPTHRLMRSSRFRDGRRIFKSAVRQWGQEWACQTALQNLGSEIDFSDYATGRLVAQPPPSEIPPLPTLKSTVIEGLAAQSVD